MLSLVVLAVDEANRRAEARQALAEGQQVPAVGGVDELGTGDRDRRRDLDRGEQLPEGVLLGGRVGAEQPQPLVLLVGGGRPQAHRDGGAEG